MNVMEKTIELTKGKNGNFTSAEVKVNGSFAVHAERTAPGSFHIYQRSTSAGRLAPSVLPASLGCNQGSTIDWQFPVVLPMTIVIESESEVTDCKIVTADEQQQA